MKGPDPRRVGRVPRALPGILPLAVAVAAAVAIEICVAGLGLAAGPPYRWTDEEGVVHFVDSLEKVPERYRPRAPEPPPIPTPDESVAPGAPPTPDTAGHGGPAWIGRPPGPGRTRPSTEDQIRAVEESWEPKAWIARGRSALAAVFLFALAIHGGLAIGVTRRRRALASAISLYERYLETRDRKEPDLAAVLELEERMEGIRKLVVGLRPGTTKLRLAEEAPGSAGATSGVVDAVVGSLTRNEAVTEAFRSCLREALGAARYAARMAVHPLALADLAVHLPRHLLTGFGARRVRSERWMRLVELLYWVFAVVCLSVWS